jgi:hypothetical protein
MFRLGVSYDFDFKTDKDLEELICKAVGSPCTDFNIARGRKELGWLFEDIKPARDVIRALQTAELNIPNLMFNIYNPEF